MVFVWLAKYPYPSLRLRDSTSALETRPLRFLPQHPLLQARCEAFGVDLTEKKFVKAKPVEALAVLELEEGVIGLAKKFKLTRLILPAKLQPERSGPSNSGVCALEPLVSCFYSAERFFGCWASHAVVARGPCSALILWLRDRLRRWHCQGRAQEQRSLVRQVFRQVSEHLGFVCLLRAD